MFYICFLSYGFGYGRSFSGPNIRLRPKVKIVPTVQHCSFVKDKHKVCKKWPEMVGNGRLVCHFCFETDFRCVNENKK